MEQITRRNFNAGLLGSLFTFSLVETLCRGELLAGTVKPVAARWLAEVEEVSRTMKSRKVKQTEWQQKIEELFARVEMKDLLSAIDFDRLSKKMKFPDDHEAVIETDPPRPEGLPAELSFSTFIYGLRKGRAIVPHCHRNMTSMHMVIGGQMHGWHFDRLADEPEHLIIRPTLDKQLAPGEVSTTSDDKDNIHWFRAVSDAAFTFNIGVYGIDPAVSFTGRQFYLDPAGGEKLGDGSLRVRHLKPYEAYRLYGRPDSVGAMKL
ncbi:MAG TPA: hypothetical protein VFD58_30930 [Blastocatellia bacterium]|nr:hypothetical protein [Blastocatellia bacterium]